jgi:hypothetical protein
VNLPTVRCDTIKANATALQGLCQLITGTASALVEGGTVDDAAHVKEVSMCGITKSQCQATDATTVAGRVRLLRRQETSITASLTTSMATGDETADSLLTVSTSGGAVNDAIGTSYNSLTYDVFGDALVTELPTDPTKTATTAAVTDVRRGGGVGGLGCVHLVGFGGSGGADRLVFHEAGQGVGLAAAIRVLQLALHHLSGDGAAHLAEVALDPEVGRLADLVHGVLLIPERSGEWRWT